MTRYHLLFIPLVLTMICISNAHAQYVPINAIVWSADDTKIAISTIDSVEIRDAMTNDLLVFITPDNEIVDLQWSPNGNRLAGSSSETSIYIWDATTGALLGTLTGFNERHSNLAWNPDGITLYSLGLDYELFEWNTTNFTLVASHDSYIGGGRDLEVSPDGSYLAVGVSRAVLLYDLNDWSYSFVSTNHTNEVFSVSWNNDNNRIASGDFDGNIFIWNIINAQESFFLNRTNVPELGGIVQWLDDTLLSDRGVDGLIRIWDTTTSQLIYTATSVLPGYSDTYSWNNARTQIAYGTVSGTIAIETLNYEDEE